jgi:hypothetical protein
MKALRILTILATLTTAALADKLPYEASDTIASTLKKQVGQKVELRVAGGEKLGGKVEAVGDKTVHLSALTGQEFFDAVVSIDQITAVVVRTGGR